MSLSEFGRKLLDDPHFWEKVDPNFLRELEAFYDRHGRYPVPDRTMIAVLSRAVYVEGEENLGIPLYCMVQNAERTGQLIINIPGFNPRGRSTHARERYIPQELRGLHGRAHYFPQVANVYRIIHYYVTHDQKLPNSTKCEDSTIVSMYEKLRQSVRQNTQPGGAGGTARLLAYPPELVDILNRAIPGWNLKEHERKRSPQTGDPTILDRSRRVYAYLLPDDAAEAAAQDEACEARGEVVTFPGGIGVRLPAGGAGGGAGAVGFPQTPGGGGAGEPPPPTVFRSPQPATPVPRAGGGAGAVTREKQVRREPEDTKVPGSEKKPRAEPSAHGMNLLQQAAEQLLAAEEQRRGSSLLQRDQSSFGRARFVRKYMKHRNVSRAYAEGKYRKAMALL